MGLGSFLGGLFGTKEKTQEFQRYTPQQTQALDQLLGGGQRLLPSGFEFLESLLSQDPAQMQAFERPALRQFNEEIIPGIAERFVSTFGPSSLTSSAFGQQLGKAGAGLSERLQAQRSGLGLQSLEQLRSLLGGGLGQRSDKFIRPAQPGLIDQLGPLLGQLGSAYLGAPGLGGGF